jgi:nicotinamidase-related amidase
MTDKVRLHVQSQQLYLNAKGYNEWRINKDDEEFQPERAAILICDMWDRHWSRAAEERAADLAVQINSVVKMARDKGIHIIHAPSDTMDFYQDHPGRKRLLNLQNVIPPVAKELPDPAMPVDSSDGGSDSGETKQEIAWTRQSRFIEIDEERDVIAGDEGGLVYNFLIHQQISHLFYMGVHTNMCVLNRSFGIKQMTRWGIRCRLVKDLTDTMYNPERPPYVSHEEGTRLVIEYIEKFWCPTVHSSGLHHSFS